MTIDLDGARDFVATHARILDRRRLGLLLGDDDRSAVLAALDAYHNLDGGYGWGLESDLRSTESQPGPALHAFEVFAEVGPLTTPRSAELCDWLGSISLPDGGVPFSLPIENDAGCAPWWAGGDGRTSSLQITAIVAANAHRVERHDPVVRNHPWLAAATAYCAAAIRNLEESAHAYELAFAAQFLDAAGNAVADAPALRDRVARHIPGDGVVRVQGGTENEALRALDFAPLPGGPMRETFDPDVIASELRRLEQQQQEDGGWPYEPRTFSPASALEWRGYVTVRAVWILKSNEGGIVPGGEG
ncbi:MAG: hypothetical protein M3273_00520 [Actinomycetota bacterium]|nr:hypothetical protein [Actinomycetota bacterium]